MRLERGVASGNTPRRTGRPVAAGQGDVAEMTHATVAKQVCQKQLTTPHCPIVTVARPVEGYSKHRPLFSVFGEDRSDVGMMVLDRYDAGKAHLFGNPSREISRMEITRDCAWNDLKESGQMIQGTAELLQRLEALEVADVRTHERLPTMSQGEGVLQMRSHGKDWHGTGHRKRDWKRRVPSSPAEKDRQAVTHPKHRVVTPEGDFPIVEQESVDDASQPVARFGVGGRYRLVAAVPTGHHQGTAHLLEQQDMERSRRQHDPDGIETGGHTRGQSAWASGAEQNYGPFRGEKETRLDGIDLGQNARFIERRYHHREGFRRPRLTAAQLGHCRLAGRVCREMKSPHPTKAEDPTVLQHR
jgi:hypothetical protein